MPESVWDYPRPPAQRERQVPVTIHLDGRLLATSDVVRQVLETSHPPSCYLPREAWADGALTASRSRGTWCEWKGDATYWDLPGLPAHAWSYEEPTAGFEALRGWVSCYPRGLTVVLGGEEVSAQPGEFYGGWVTADVVGPFKGEPGTLHW